MTNKFLQELEFERSHQRNLWGDEHDDRHTIPEWSQLILRYAGKVGDAGENLAEQMEYRELAATHFHERLVHLAAVCQAAAEALERARPDLFEE